MRNRVTPTGDIVAAKLRGAWLGNRGILHRGTDVVRFHRSSLWIICKLQHKEWRLPQWQPGHFTVLFFHDEAVALAAGHRPCALCRRHAYNAFRTALAEGSSITVPLATELDRRLHAERVYRGTHRRRFHQMPWSAVPAGTFVFAGHEPALAMDDAIVSWTTSGYADARHRPAGGLAAAITPPSTVAALRAGYELQIDPTAKQAAAALSPSPAPLRLQLEEQHTDEPSWRARRDRQP